MVAALERASFSFPAWPGRLGVRDMVGHPARHAIYQRARKIERLSAVPQSARAGHYLNQNVRKVSDDVAQVAAFPVGDETLASSLQGRQR